MNDHQWATQRPPRVYDGGDMKTPPAGNRGLTHHLMQPGKGAGSMVSIPRPPRHPDFSPERRQVMLGLLSDDDFLSADLPESARILYAVSGLVCDDAGVALESDIAAALDDPSVIQYARSLLKRAVA